MMGMHSYSVSNEYFVNVANESFFIINDNCLDKEKMILEYCEDDKNKKKDEDEKEMISELKRWI